MRGLKVLLLDKGDIGSGTTSWSTRLIHGGLRYLEYFGFPLVRESLLDREKLLKIAPHLVKPLPFVVPIYDHSRRGPAMIRPPPGTTFGPEDGGGSWDRPEAPDPGVRKEQL